MRYAKDIGGAVGARREYVIDTAFRTFAERGIETVSMNDVAKDCGMGIASVYRYFGTKAELVIAIGTKKWHEYYEIIERKYKRLGIAKLNGARELEFYIDSYILLYRKYQDILRFNMYFDTYITRENVGAEMLADYYEAVNLFAAKFHVVYEKAKDDRTVRTDISELEMFSTIMHTMLLTASKYACGLVYPPSASFNRLNALLQIKQMLLDYYCE